jgi:hypothetical protein
MRAAQTTSGPTPLQEVANAEASTVTQRVNRSQTEPAKSADYRWRVYRLPQSVF